MTDPQTILRHFEISLQGKRIPVEEFDFKTHGQGLINNTYLVSLGGETKFVLQRINDKVFANMEALKFNIETVLPVLGDDTYTPVEYVETKNGEMLLEHKSETWRLMEFLEDSRSYDTTSDHRVAFEAGHVIGKFHLLTSSISASSLKVTIPRFHDLGWRLEQFKQALEEGIPERIVYAQSWIDFILRNSDFVRSIDTDRMPLRVCHNDTKLNNILFSEENKGLCLIDLDTLMPGSLIYDLGDALRTLANPAREDETDLSRIGFDLSMFEAFVQGFQASGIGITSEEHKGISRSVSYMPFMHGIRALTDFVLGDKYYTVKYPEENLDRAASLLTFSSCALDNLDHMDRSLRELTGGFSG